MIEASLARERFVFGLTPARNRDQYRIVSPGLEANSLGYLISVQLWQPDVQQYDVGLSVRWPFRELARRHTQS